MTILSLIKTAESFVKVENIADYEQILFFPQCFQKTCTANIKKQGLVWEKVNSLLDNKILDWSKLKQIADDILRCI